MLVTPDAAKEADACHPSRCPFSNVSVAASEKAAPLAIVPMVA